MCVITNENGDVYIFGGGGACDVAHNLLYLSVSIFLIGVCARVMINAKKSQRTTFGVCVFNLVI